MSQHQPLIETVFSNDRTKRTIPAQILLFFSFILSFLTVSFFFFFNKFRQIPEASLNLAWYLLSIYKSLYLSLCFLFIPVEFCVQI